MMAKILITSLGTGKREDGSYKKAKYCIDNKIYETAFIAHALNMHLQLDKIFIIGTNKSIWDEAYLAFGGKDNSYHEMLFDKKELGHTGLKDLEPFESIMPQGSKSYLIDYGLNESQIWNNFEVFIEISKQINDGDEIYLDITHSFRSLALMSFVMTQFTSTISNKKFKISGVYYGMFEYSYETEQNITPIVDIKILLEIQEWIKAIDAIKKYSDFKHLIALLQDSDIEKEVSNIFIQLNDAISMANVMTMQVFLEHANKKINAINKSQNQIIKLLAPEIHYLVTRLYKQKLSEFQYLLAEWFYQNSNYALAYIALYEGIITKSCELRGSKPLLHENREAAKKSIGNDKYGKYFYTKYPDSISNIRNAIVHQSAERELLVKNDINKLKEFLTFFKSYFEL